MSEFTVLVLRFAFFALLWLFVFLIAGVLRQDLFGPRRRGNRASRRRGGVRGAPAVQQAMPSQPAPLPGAAAPLPPPVPAPASVPAAASISAPAAHQQRPRELHIMSGALAGMTVSLSSAPITIGRSSDNTIVLDDDFASGRHARIMFDRGQWFVEDLGSTNGTFIRDQRLTAPVPLHVGTPVTIGHTSMELRP